MADAFRPKVSTTSSIKAAYGMKVKTSRVTATKNQQSPGATTQTSVLPRIDRRGELPQKPHVPSIRQSQASAKNGGLSILLPPRRPSTKDAIPNAETSPTYHDDEFSAKAAWGTPRNPAPELPTGSRVASFFAAPESSGDNYDSSISIPTPLRLQSVEESISANEEKYRVDMEQLASNNDKFFEISMSANQHLEYMHNQLPDISEAFDHTDSALQSLSSDIVTLHQQHKSAMNDMENRLEVAMSNNAEEMVTLSEARANEKAEIFEAHKHDLQKANEAFREKIAELEHRHTAKEKKYLDELQELRQTSESQIQALQDLNRAEEEENKQSAKTALEALQSKAQQELDDLRSRTQAAYTELQNRSQAEFAELQRTSTEELAAVKACLTSEIESLKKNATDSLAALASRSERELQEHREQSNESLQHLKVFYAQEREYLLEKAAEEVARLRMFEIEQSTRMENRRCRETKALQYELEATKTKSSTQIEKLHRRYTSELETLRATSEAEKKLLLQTHAAKIESTLATAAQELSQAISLYEDKLHSMAEAHATEVARNKEEAAHATDILVTKYESDLASLQNERAREKDALILYYETDLQTFKQESREEHDKNVQLHETQVLQLREAHSSKVLSLEITMREQNKKAEDTIHEKDAELERKQERIKLLEASEIAQKERHKQYAERSLEIVEQKNMALSELESEIWRLDQLILIKDAMLDNTNRALKTAEEDLQVKASTILELTFVIKSRDDEIEKLRNALLDTVETVNTKTEILELTTETLSTKAKELEATKNALRLESGKLSMVEESMIQKVGILENTELKMESMRLNMENMRLEMKRMQMDMKLQLEHTEGEIELKNGEIRRLHGTQSELKQKNDFCQQTIERLEESLAFAQRQGEEAQRRIELLRLEATQAAEDMKKVCDELLSKEQDVVIMTREKQTIVTEKQRLQIQLNNLTQTTQTLHERVELHTMQAEEIQCHYQRRLQETTAEKDERIRSEKHLHMLELSAAKGMIRHLEGVEERLSATASKLEVVASEKQHLQAEIKTLNETLKRYENTDQELHAANGNIELKSKLIESQTQELVELNKRLNKSEDGAQHQLDMSLMEIEDSMATAWSLVCDKDKVLQLNNSLEAIISNLRVEKEQLMLSLGQEKREIVNRVEDLQEKMAGLRKEGAKASSEISDLQHALGEKMKELKYLQENLGEQTTDTRKIKSVLDTLSSAHTELQAQFASLSNQRQKEEEEHLETIQLLQENVDNKSKQCEALQQSLDIQRQEIDLLMVQHDSHVMQLADGHRSDVVQLIERHRAQIAQMTEEHLKLADSHLAQVTKLKEKHIIEVSQLTNDRESEVTQLTDQISRLLEEHRSEIAQLQETHQDEVGRLTDTLRYQISELTVERISQITEQTEKHRTEVDRLIRDHDKEVATLTASHQTQINQMTKENQTEAVRLNHSDIVRLKENHNLEVARLVEEHRREISSLKETQQFAIDRLKDDHHYQISELTVNRLSHITEQSEEHRLLLSRLDVHHDKEVAQLNEDHQSEVDRLIETHQNYVNENQQQVLLQQATDEQIRVICAHSLELMTVEVAHQQNIGQMKQHVMQIERSYHKRLAELQLKKIHLAAEQSQALAAMKWLDAGNAQVLINLGSENAQSLEGLKSEYAQPVMTVKQQHKTEMDAARQSANECYEQALAGHKKIVDELNETFTQDTELMDLPFAEEHLRRVNELLERTRVEEERFHKELSDKSSGMKIFKDVLTASKVEISEPQAQLQDAKQAVSERDAVVAAKNASIDNELNHLLGLRSAEILASNEEAADFIQRCKNALLLPDDMFTSDDIVEAIEQLMKILQHFELLQPKLGSPRRQLTATDPPPTLKNKVTAILAFVEELQLIADFAQNILNDEIKDEDDPASNESSRSSLEALRALTRTPSPAPTLDELQIDVDVAVDDAMQAFDQHLCEFSNEEGDKQQDDFFASPEDQSSSRLPSPFLADSLMDISLVMSDHHRLLSQTARWVAKSRQGEARNNAFSVGAEISRLVRDHCALLSLSRRLFKMKDPQQELVSLLEGVALLERMGRRLAIFQPSPARVTDETSIHSSSDSVTSLDRSCSIESISHPVLASIGDMARCLQDYDYFLQHVKLDGCMGQENNSPATINIEALVQEINERVMLVDRSKELLGLHNPVEELPPLLVGAKEVLRQAKQLREVSVCFEESTVKSGGEPHQREAIGEPGNGFETLLSEMDAIVEDLRIYHEMLAWLRQVLPHLESVKTITDLKDRVKGVLIEVETLTTNNTNLMQDSTSLTSALEQMKQTRDHLVEEASKEGALLQELAALEAQALLSPVDEVSTRIELVQALIKQQQHACDDAQQRREDMIMETAFLQQHDLLQTDDANEIALSTNVRLGIYARLLKRADDMQSEKIEIESSLKEEIKQKSEKLESAADELEQTRQEMENSLAEEQSFLASKEICSSLLSIGQEFSRIDVYGQLHDEITRLRDEKHAVETCAAQEYEFLRTNELLPESDDAVSETTVPTTPMMSSIRLEAFQHLVDSLAQLRQHEDDLTQENRFLQENNLAFDLNEPKKSRLAVYETLLAGQNALIEEKMEREVAVESEKAFLASHGVPAFENPTEIYEQYVEARKQLAYLTSELEEELRFLTENQLCCSIELSDSGASLITPFSSSFRLLVYRKFIRAEVQARETIQQLKETLEQHLAMQIVDEEGIITLLATKVERLEASLMGWQESAYASQREWDRMLLEEEDKRRSLIRQHEEAMKQVADEHAHALKEITEARDSAVALASATHVEALEEITMEHERQLAAELHKQAQQFELVAFVHAESEARKQASDSSILLTSTSISAAQSRAQLLEKLAKRDTTAISMIYKAIRLTTDILSAAPTTSAASISTSTPRLSEVSTDVTQTVLACVKELKTLKEFLVQSLEQVSKDDDQVPPSFTKAPYAKWMADAVTRATADTDCAIDLALCSHREFMSFAEVQLLTRQEEVEKALTRVYEKLKTTTTNGGFTPDQEKQLALELEITRERETRENVACKFRLNEEYYRRLLDERKEMEIAQSTNVEGLRDECKTLRVKLGNLEQQIQQQSVLQQFRPPSSSMRTLSPRASVASQQIPRVLKTAAISNVPMPMRPERPRGGGSVHKDRFVSDLERETGQRRTNTVARRFNDLKTREDAITENPGSQLEQDFRAMQAMIVSHHIPAMEPVIPTAMAAPATAPGSSLQNQELWYQGVRSIHYVSFFISIFHVPKQHLFRVEVFNSDTEQQQQTVYVTWTEMQEFLQQSKKATRLGITLPTDPEMAVTLSQTTRGEIMDILFERVRVYGEGTENILLGFE